MTEPLIVTFDPQRRAADPDLKAALKLFTAHLEKQESFLGTRKRARTERDRRAFLLSVEVIAINLLIAAMVSPDAVLAVPRGHAAIWKQGRYSNSVYGQHFIDILDLLERLELTERLTSGFRFSPQHRQPTTIRPTPALSGHLPLEGTSWTDFKREEEPEVIILKPVKDPKGQASPIDYQDTKLTVKWRREIKAINGWLQGANIEVLGDEHHAVRLDKAGQPIEPYRRTLRRVFNNGDWNAGGRLFGGFWMTMEREARFDSIKIDGQKIVNVDYSSLFPRMAYARAQTEQPDFDLYDVTGDGTCRDGWKQFINALLFAKRPLKGWPTDTAKEFPRGTKLSAVLNASKRKHAPIAKLFEQGLGFQLMHHESEMLVAVVTALFKNGITALPLHDSVLVAYSHADRAKSFMEKEFILRTGSSRAFVKVDKSPN